MIPLDLHLGFGSLRSALNIIFRVEKDRSLLQGKAVDLFMVLLAGTLLLMSMALSSVNTLFQGYLFRSLLDIGFISWLKYTIQIHGPLFGRIPSIRYSKRPKIFLSAFFRDTTRGAYVPIRLRNCSLR